MVKIYKSFFIVFLLSFGFSFAQKPVSSFSLSSIRGGSPFSLKPNNTSTNASVYIWNFGDGNTSNAFQPINTFLKPGTYTISLLAIGGSGLKDSSYSEKKITVVPNPVANFSVNVQSNCLNDNLYEFKNLSLDASSFTWDFGDGFTDTVPNPKHKYTVDGTYNVRLLVRNEFGMADLKIMLSCATVFNPPVAIFSVDSVLGCNLNHNFHFINQSLSSESYLWSFGDGTVSSLKNATHLYAKEGVYTVSLVVTDSNHCSDKMVKSDYIIASSPHSPFVKASLQQGCAPLKVAFSGTSEKAVSWLWDFGNGKTSTLQNPEYVYDSAGIFDVRVSILDGKNCPSSLGLPGFIKSQKNTVSANFTNATHQGCSPLTVLFNNQSLQGDSWLWDFGDGSQSTFKNPSHTYIKTGDFKVQLTSYSKENCSAKFIANGPIMVFLPKASFQMNQSPGCAPYLASFKNTSALAQKYVWRFGDGDSSLDENPTHTYLAPGDYSVTLIAINNSGCADTMKAASFIHVVNPGANYTSSTPIKGCAPLSASFSDNTPGASAWQWKFGDGGSSTERQPTHLYTKDGLYKVSLLMHISGGCTQSFPMFRTVQVFNGVANFNVTQSECSAPYEAVFKDSSLNASSWLWDFGDSTSSTVQNPVHTYKNKGAYSVKLQTKTKEGCESTLVESNALFFVDCGPPPGPGDTGLPPSAGPPLSAGTGITLVKIGNIPLVQIPSIKGCAPLRVSFHSPKKDYVAYIWDFGDGNFSKSEFPVHVYMKRGKYDVKLMGKAVKGNWDTLVFPGYVSLSATLPSFAIVKESNCDNNSIFIKDSTIGAGVYLWDFGDGSTSMLSSPKHVYARSQNNLTVSVKIADLLGCPGSASKSFFLGNDVPLLSASKQNICLGEEVQFFCSSFNYGSFLWDFGDGEVSTEKFPKHLFKKRGMYSVQILMKDEKGCSHIFKLNETTRVYDSKVGFTYSLRKGCNSLTVDFVNQQKSPDAYETQKYLWNFGDGSTSSKNEESHVYAAAGTYTISLTGFSENGCSTLVSKTINVFPSTIADFSFSQDKSCLPVKTSFNNRSTANCVSYQWEFGDGAISKERTPAHLFNQVPNGIIKLTVTDSLGCIVTTSKPGITLFKASFKVSEAMACQGQNIVFKNETEKAIGWSWSFGDGAISKTENPIHAYTNNGEFKARLIAEDNEGCIDTSISAVSIPEIKADFTSPTPTACAPSLVNFNTNSINAIKYDWDFGDGTGSVSSRPSHIYNVPGFYSIRLIVKNEAGCNDTLTRHNYVHVVGPIPSFTVSRKEGCFSFDVNFTNLSQGAKKYTWNFGDGYTSEKSSPVHQYKNEGDHAVTLIVSDSIGCQAHFTLAEPIKVYPGPKFNVVTTDSVGCFPLTVVFKNKTKNANHFVWNLGDGQKSSLVSPMHTFNQSPGIFKPQLFATPKQNFRHYQLKVVFLNLFHSLINQPTPLPGYGALVMAQHPLKETLNTLI
jgi:PKD repeat protein